MGEITMESVIKKSIQDIKDYVKSIDKADNINYQENSLLIDTCFSKAIEIIEANVKAQSSQQVNILQEAEKGAELINATFNYDDRLVSIYRCVECAKRNESTGVKKAVEVVEKEPYGDLLDAMILYWLFVAFIALFCGFILGQNWFYLLQTFNGF